MKIAPAWALVAIFAAFSVVGRIDYETALATTTEPATHKQGEIMSNDSHNEDVIEFLHGARITAPAAEHVTAHHAKPVEFFGREKASEADYIARLESSNAALRDALVVMLDEFTHPINGLHGVAWERAQAAINRASTALAMAGSIR